jgi:hypothetical protein
MAAGAAAAPRPQVRELCTVSDRNYLPRLLALIESLDRHDARRYRLHVICLDAVALEVLQRLGHAQVVPIPVETLEAHDPGLGPVRAGRSLAEYSWTLKPSLLLFLLTQHPRIEALAYLDADLFFFAPLERLLGELGEGSVLIHRHNFSPHHAHLERESGTFNAGMVAFRNDARGRDVLSWWRKRCLEWCFARVEGTRKSGDQGYLDHWPSTFEGVSIARSPGIGTALWSHRNAAVDVGPDGALTFGGAPMAFFHMHGFDAVGPGLFVPAKDLPYRPTLPLLRHCYLPYVEVIERGEVRVRELSSRWSPARGWNGLTSNHVVLARRELRGPILQAGIRHPIVELDAGWDCHLGPQALA